MVADGFTHFRVRCFRLSVGHNIQHAVETTPPNIADAFVFISQHRQAFLQISPCFGGVVRQIVPQHHLQLLQRHCGGQRVLRISTGPRQAHGAACLLGDFRCSDRAAKREPGRQALAEGDDIRDHAVRLEPPERS